MPFWPVILVECGLATALHLALVLDRTSACARTMLGIFEPECRVPGLRQSAAALLRQIAWAGLSGRVTAEALPRCFGSVRRAGSGLCPL